MLDVEQQLASGLASGATVDLSHIEVLVTVTSESCRNMGFLLLTIVATQHSKNPEQYLDNNYVVIPLRQYCGGKHTELVCF